MKRIVFYLILLFLIFYSSAGMAQLEETEIRVTGVSLNQSNLVMKPGSTEILSAVVLPEDAAQKEVNWINSDPLVIQVIEYEDNNHSAEIIALSPGTATVTVITEDGSKKAVCQIEVLVPIRSVSLKITEITLYPSQEMQLTVHIEPRDAANQQLTWVSTDPGIADVDANGLIKAKKNGHTRIVVRSDEDESLTAYCNVTVTGSPMSAETGIESPEETEPVVVPQEPERGTWLSGSSSVYGLSAGAVALLAAATFFISRGRRQSPAAVVTPAGVEHHTPKPFVTGISGHFAGKKIEFVEQLIIGRDSSVAGLVYPVYDEGISRKHCTVSYDEANGKFILEDCSSNGTFLSSGERLNPGQQYQLGPGERFYLSSPEELFEVNVE